LEENPYIEREYYYYSLGGGYTGKPEQIRLSGHL